MMNRLLAFLAAVVLAAPLSAKEPTMPGKSSLAAPALTTISGTPLRINVGADNSYQVFNSAIVGAGGNAGQIYPSSATQTADMGWFVRVNGQLFAPNFGDHPGGTATGGLGSPVDFGETSLSTVTGNGTSNSPFTVELVNNVGGTGLSARTRVSYINGDSYFLQQFRLVNTGTGPVQATVFLGSDIYLATSDSGVPFQEPTSSSPGGRTCPGIVPDYTILHIPLTPADRFTAAFYSSVWQQIGGGGLDNTISTGCIDNGAALQWNVTVPPIGSVTLLAATSFGPIPPITQFNVTDVNPSQGVFGTSVPVTITGFGFQPGTTFSFGAGIQVTNVVIQGPTTASATLVISPDAVFGFRDVIATQTPGGISAILYDGFAVTDLPVWNYSITSVNNVNVAAINCVRQRFPGDPSTNLAGWAPNEGEWFQENTINPFFPLPPIGLARAILDCYMGGRAWDANTGALYPAYCWDNPTPWYQGQYPDSRVAQLRVYFSFNGECLGPQPGWPIVEENVSVIRTLFFPAPLVRSGFESP